MFTYLPKMVHSLNLETSFIYQTLYLSHLAYVLFSQQWSRILRTQGKKMGAERKWVTSLTVLITRWKMNSFSSVELKVVDSTYSTLKIPNWSPFARWWAVTQLLFVAWRLIQNRRHCSLAGKTPSYPAGNQKMLKVVKQERLVIEQRSSVVVV